MEALLVPLVIFELSTSVLLVLAIRNEFFSKKDLPYLPYFVGILAFGGIVFLIEGGLSQNIKLLSGGLLIVTVSIALAISSMMRKK